MSRTVKVNFTQADLDKMQSKIHEAEETSLEVFEWNISNCDVIITVGPDD